MGEMRVLSVLFRAWGHQGLWEPNLVGHGSWGLWVQACGYRIHTGLNGLKI